MKTYFPKEEDIAKKDWYVVDADGATLGRLAAKDRLHPEGEE